MHSSKLSFGAIKLEEISKIKEGTKIKDEETGEVWTVKEKPGRLNSYEQPQLLQWKGCQGYELGLYKTKGKENSERYTLLRFDPKSSPKNEDPRFTIVA